MKRIGGFNCVAVLHVKSQEIWLIPLNSASMIVASIILSNTLGYSSLIPLKQHEPRISFRFTRSLRTFLRLRVNGTHAQAMHPCDHNLGLNRNHLLIGKQSRGIPRELNSDVEPCQVTVIRCPCRRPLPSSVTCSPCQLGSRTGEQSPLGNFYL